MDITKLTDADLAYMEGFVQKCAELGLDPEDMLKGAAECGKKCVAKKPGAKKAFGGKAAPLFQKKSQDTTPEPVSAAPAPQKKTIMGGIGKGALTGGAIGAMLGGGTMAAAGAGALSRMPGDSRKKLVIMLKAIAAGAGAGAAGGAISGGMMGGVMRAVQ